MINQIPQRPSYFPPPHGPMLYYTIFNWALEIIFMVLLFREAYRKKTPMPLAFILGAMLASWVEPVFDGNIHVEFVYPPGVEPSWHIYNVPYPWFEFAGNATLAGPLYFIYHKFKTGITARGLWWFFVAGWAFDAIQELPGTAMGAYVYFGPHPFKVLNWPVWVGMMAPIGYALVGYAAYVMEEIMSGAKLFLCVVVLLPVILYGCEVIDWPMWDTLNGGQTVTVTAWAAVLSLIFTLVGYYVMIELYLHKRPEFKRPALKAA